MIRDRTAIDLAAARARGREGDYPSLGKKIWHTPRRFSNGGMNEPGDPPNYRRQRTSREVGGSGLITSVLRVGLRGTGVAASCRRSGVSTIGPSCVSLRTISSATGRRTLALSSGVSFTICRSIFSARAAYRRRQSGESVAVACAASASQRPRGPMAWAITAANGRVSPVRKLTPEASFHACIGRRAWSSL